MKHYFLVAKDVGDLTRILCASLEAKQMKDAPALSRVFGRFRPEPPSRIADAPAFRLEGGRVVLKSPRRLRDGSGQPHPAVRRGRTAWTPKSIPMP